jgi:mRNA-degrading endonuclease RelE of RelBE toxin-antitoxin system
VQHASASDVPWRLRYAAQILSTDLPALGEASFAMAKAAILKKLATFPDRYGAPLRTPLGGMRKLRVSNLRIIYKVFPAQREVWIYMIGARRDIWDHDQPEILERAEEIADRMLAQRARARPDRGC